MGQELGKGLELDNYIFLAPTGAQEVTIFVRLSVQS